MVGGVGHDLYPRDWSRCEATANFDSYSAYCLARAEIVYSRSPEDSARFKKLREKLYDNLQNKDFVYRKALVKIDEAMNFYRTLMFEEQFHKAYMGLGFIEYNLATAVFLLNSAIYSWNSYYFEELCKLPNIPGNFVEYHNAMLTARSVDDCRSLANLLINATRRFAAGFKPEVSGSAKTPDVNLANWYAELSLKWRRIYHYCEIRNAGLALIDAVDLQSELNIVASEYGLNEMDLLSSFDASDLSKISARSEEIERYILAELERNGVKIRSYATIDEFLAEN
jgi:hypothetical protein